MVKIKRIEPSVPAITPRKKVAAYARVSRDGERLLHSFSAQVSYYSSLIQKNPEWEYAGVYSDEAVTGTRTDWRDGFQEMLKACDEGKIDIILTKSVSRFARNTVDLLNTVRHLKEIGVEVRFEEQNISTMSGDGELMLTILASFAQEEVISTSQNIKWAKKKQAEQGIMTNTSVPYGYICEDRTPVIVPEEAAIVRRIFQEYLDSATPLRIAERLNAEGVPTRYKGEWTATTIHRMLGNTTYTGNMILGKWYTGDPLTHSRVKNRGEQDMYLVEDSHTAIINQELFDKVQSELARRSKLKQFVSPKVTLTEFSGKIICGGCGMPFYRYYNRMKGGIKVPGWACKKPGGKCPTPGLLEQEIREMFCQVTGSDEYDADEFERTVEHIDVDLDDSVHFHFKDGTKETVQFKRRKRSPLKAKREEAVAMKEKVFCEKCGSKYVFMSQKSEKEGGGRIGYWRCKHKSDCGIPSLRDDDLKNVIAEVMELPTYDEEAFLKKIKGISVRDSSICITFVNGKETVREWNPPSHKGSKWTEERKRQARESGVYKRQWTEERRRQASEIAKRQRRERKNAKS